MLVVLYKVRKELEGIENKNKGCRNFRGVLLGKLRKLLLFSWSVGEIIELLGKKEKLTEVFIEACRWRYNGRVLLEL